MLRRGFQISPNEKFIVVEDVVTRGGRVQETIDIVRAHGGIVTAVGVIVDRSGDKKPDFGCPFVSFVRNERRNVSAQTSSRLISRKFPPSNPAANSGSALAAASALQFQQLGELLGIGHRRFAGEVFADVRGWFAFDHRHGANRFVFLAEIFLAFTAIGQKQNCLRQKMAMHLSKKCFRLRRILLPGDHDLSRLA